MPIITDDPLAHYAFSLNGEDWGDGQYDSREAAIEAAREDEPDGPIWTARCRAPVVDLSGLDVVEHLYNWCEDDFGLEEAEEWPAQFATGAQRDELAAMLADAFKAWAEKHGYTPEWWIAEDVQRHDVPERLTLGAAREMATK